MRLGFVKEYIPLAMKQVEPLSGSQLTVKDRLYRRPAKETITQTDR